MTDSMNEANQPDSLHSGYEEWKGWTEDKILPKSPHPTNQDYFTQEMERAKILPGSKILEIGFGNGEFLRWAEFNGTMFLELKLVKNSTEWGGKEVPSFSWNCGRRPRRVGVRL